MKRLLFPLSLTAALLLGACTKPEEPKAPEAAPANAPAAAGAVSVDPAKLAAFGTLPTAMESQDNPLTEEKIALGKMLYYETRLSKNQEISCNSCHMLDAYGVDGQPTSPGDKGQRGGRNSPTAYNAGGHIAQFWDGRAASLEEQAKGPILNPIEMAMKDEAAVLEVLKSMPAYVDAFAKAFPGEADPMSYNNLAKAIGAFERKLVTPSRWDKFLMGDQTALTDDEKKGFNTFVDTGCVTCHTGAYVGGGMFQKLGLVKPWPNTNDKGREDVTKNAADTMMFKVPSLRNIEKTAPYFHDGGVASLPEAIKLMADHQLGKQLSDEDVKSIEAWLKSLTGELPTAYITKPELPASTDKTPKADKG